MFKRIIPNNNNNINPIDPTPSYLFVFKNPLAFIREGLELAKTWHYKCTGMILFVLALLLFPSAAPCGCCGGRRVAPDVMTTPFTRAFLWLDRTVMSMLVPCRGLMSAPPSYGPAAGEGCIPDGYWPRGKERLWVPSSCKATMLKSRFRKEQDFGDI
ncbi:hypothetical protein FH972_004872 [Carpinus fangiana]|uniref:Uncharacterized protein n=1 Tax=Carpinus fangiana TaxID=176857 RepID=A0A5N6QMI7_9ROSI|nr:hypothetical protein FH972_004872 [Carpinus fangiana]